MTIINNSLFLNSPEDNVYPEEALDSSLPTGQDVVIMQPSATLGNMPITGNEISLLAQGNIVEMEESQRERPSIVQANISETALEDIFRPITQNDILGLLPAQTEANGLYKKRALYGNISSVHSVPISSTLPEAANRSEPEALSTYLLKEGIVPAHLTSSKSIKINVNVPFLISLYKNTKQENKNKISEHIQKIGQGAVGINGHSFRLSCVELLEVLNLPENEIFFTGQHARQTYKYLKTVKENLFVPPVLNANDEHIESFYETISTLLEAAKKNSLDPATAAYFETYLKLASTIKNKKTKLSFERTALIELLNCQNVSTEMSKQQQNAYYTLRKKIPLEKGEKRKRVQKKAQCVSELPNQQRHPKAKAAKTTTEQAESLLNPFDKDAAEYLQLTKTPPGGEFPFPFLD